MVGTARASASASGLAPNEAGLRSKPDESEPDALTLQMGTGPWRTSVQVLFSPFNFLSGFLGGCVYRGIDHVVSGSVSMHSP